MVTSLYKLLLLKKAKMCVKLKNILKSRCFVSEYARLVCVLRAVRVVLTDIFFWDALSTLVWGSIYANAFYFFEVAGKMKNVKKALWKSLT